MSFAPYLAPIPPWSICGALADSAGTEGLPSDPLAPEEAVGMTLSTEYFTPPGCRLHSVCSLTRGVRMCKSLVSWVIFFFFLLSHNLIYCFAEWEHERPWVYESNMPKELLRRLVILRFHLSEDFDHLKSRNHPSSSLEPWEFQATIGRQTWPILSKIHRRKCRHMANFWIVQRGQMAVSRVWSDYLYRFSSQPTGSRKRGKEEERESIMHAASGPWALGPLVNLLCQSSRTWPHTCLYWKAKE